MTLNEIELAIYRRTGYADTPATEVVTRIRQWINIWYERLLARPGIEILRDVTSSFPTVPAQSLYLLPPSVRRIKKIFEHFTPLVLRMESHEWSREVDPGDQATGNPEVWIPVTWTVATPPMSQLQIRLWPTPTSVMVFYVDCQTTVSQLVNATDVPVLPPEFHWLLVEAACYEEWLRKADTRAGTSRQDLETGFKEMRHWLQNPPDYKPTNAETVQRPSRLGGQFPAW